MNLRRYLLLAVPALLLGCSAVERTVAPAVSYQTLTAGGLTTEALQGKVYLVNFWATSCTSCVAEMPELARTYEQFKGRGFEMIAVAMSYDRPDFIARFTQTRGLPFVVAHDADGSVSKAWGNVNVTPTSFVVGAQGQVLKRYVGPPDFKQLAELLDRELPKGNS